jgi:Raf kinase inhibitor-like YbhB/YbcL family protein
VLRRWTAIVLALTASCGGTVTSPGPASGGGMEIESPQLEEGGTVPLEFTCDGEEVSPPLSWSSPPEGADSLTLVVDDPDAPGDTFVHWLVSGIPPDVTGVERGEVPRGGTEEPNSAGRTSYVGPCPPEGDQAHRYRFMIRALGSDGRVLGGAILTARYGRS